MTVQANITAAAWPTSGAATTGTTGFSAVTTLTHVGSTDVPAGSGVNGYLTTADDGGGSFLIEASSGLSAQTHYYVRFFLRVVRTATALATDSTTCYLHTFTDSGTKLRGETRVRNNTYCNGLGINWTNFIASGVSDPVNTSGVSNARASIPFGRWTEVTIRLTKAASGNYACYLDRTLMQKITGMDTTTLSAGALNGQWTMTLPATAGLAWQVCGPFQSWIGTDIPMAPLKAMYPATSFVRQAHSPARINEDIGGFFTSAGTATGTRTGYAAGGTNPERSRIVVTGSAAQTYAMTTINKIGALDFTGGSFGGWTSLVFPMMYIPAGTGQIVINNDGGSALITLDISSSFLRQGGTQLAPWVHGDRYAIIVHLNSDGRAAVSLSDLTKDINVGQTWWSAPLTAWTPQALGTVVISTVLGASTNELDGVWVMNWVTIAGVDSLTHANTNGLTPVMAARNHVTEYMAFGYESSLNPSAPYMGEAQGAPRMECMIIVGRTGRTNAQFAANVLPYMTNSYGIFLVIPDGGSINEIAAIDNSAALAVSVPEAMTASDVTTITSFGTNGNRLLYTTMIERNRGTTYTALERGAILEYDRQINGTISSYADPAGTVWFSDVAEIVGDMGTGANWTDDTHPSAAGDALYASTMFQYMFQVPVTSKKSRSFPPIVTKP